MNDVIEIRSQAKRNIIVSVLFGAAGLLVGSLVMGLLPKTFYLAGIFLISASIVAFIVAWVKYREPQFSFLLSREIIHYQHRQGSWVLHWHNVQRVDIPKVTKGFERLPLDMVAIKIKDYTPFLETISPRLMTNILMEQRPLLLHEIPAKDENCASGNCYSDDLLEDDYFKGSNGQEFKGIQGMLANRMTKLRQRLGYDVFIAASDLDRSEQDFVSLLRQCHEKVLIESN